MIEVEKKFEYRQEAVLELTHGAIFLGERLFTDTYYDNSEYTLTTQDIWLRRRGDVFELKVPFLTGGEKNTTDQYRELVTEAEIGEFLQRSDKEKPLASFLLEAGYTPCAEYTTKRRKYKQGDFIIDIDETDFGFNIIEIERMVTHEDEVPDALTDILNYAKRFSLQEKKVRGKTAEYIRLYNPHHSQALIKAGIISS